ncbi:uncharacterized protein BO88DRAFT_170641 [Aspergillus vadensis CBS 113365]|uniref:Uncharacterized protein n=1 Tax=Aspergillus vadensis (strain CBS 113365 / IMI 142717 / IBT 24658) TaxID=1448311 RepID=A0A319BI41_ASPVC|nr:hypothetical protein BO88DRAFT_170641 [Aspergillus vadensis CBS 113365]PYH72826.1 hypothetical protein BO88DRAFT_170641 [Aspergillus vadensis CBS 113365]
MPAKFRLSEAKYASLDQSGPINPPSLPQRLYGSILSLRHIWREVLIVCLSSLCTGLLVNRILAPLDGRAPQPNPEYDTTSNHDRWTQFQWTTGIYSSSKPEDFDAVNKAWEEVIPAYGFVAVDHEWAVENHLPASMSLPSDPSKGVYILDA